MSKPSPYMADGAAAAVTAAKCAPSLPPTTSAGRWCVCQAETRAAATGRQFPAVVLVAGGCARVVGRKTALTHCRVLRRDRWIWRRRDRGGDSTRDEAGADGALPCTASPCASTACTAPWRVAGRVRAAQLCRQKLGSRVAILSPHLPTPPWMW